MVSSISNLKILTNNQIIVGLAIWGETDRLCFKERGQPPTGCVAADLFQKIPCFADGGPPYMTYEFSQKFANGVKVSHHPPIGQHLLRGEFLAYVYGHILLDSIYTLEEDLMQSTETVLATKYANQLKAKQPPLPTPKYEHELTSYLPYCYSNYQPHFEEQFKLDSIILQPLEGWEVRSFGLMGCSPHPYGYKDCRYAYYPLGKGVAMHLNISLHQDKSLMMMCGTALYHVSFFLAESSRFTRDQVGAGRRLEPKEWIVNCFKFEGMKAGSYILSITYDPSETANQQKEVSLTHLIHF